MDINMNEIGAQLLDIVTSYGIKIAVAIVALLIGLRCIKYINKTTNAVFEKTELDPALERFLASLISIGLKVLLVVMVISTLGVETTSLVAVMGAAGLAVGLALQGSLANFAGGALILFFKPFTLGDVIEAAGFRGTVVDIQIFNTILETPTKQIVVIPNGELSNNPVLNVTGGEFMGIETTFGIGYTDDVAQAQQIIRQVISDCEWITDTIDPLVGVSELADSSVNIKVRVFADSAHYWAVLFYLNEQIKQQLEGAGISIPFPQMDVHMITK